MIDPLPGHYLFTANYSNGTVSVFSIDAVSGALTAVSGSPFTTGGYPYGISSDISGHFLYVTDVSTNPGTVKAFTINGGTGALTAVSGSPFATGGSPYGVTTTGAVAASTATLQSVSISPANPVISTNVLGKSSSARNSAGRSKTWGSTKFCPHRALHGREPMLNGSLVPSGASAWTSDRVPRKLATSNSHLLFRVLSPIANASFVREGLARAAIDTAAGNMAGADEKVVQRILRHAKSHVTKDRYIKAFDPAVLAAMRSLETTLDTLSQCSANVQQVN